jgi:hypothetical protein
MEHPQALASQPGHWLSPNISRQPPRSISTNRPQLFDPQTLPGGGDFFGEAVGTRALRSSRLHTIPFVIRNALASAGSFRPANRTLLSTSLVSNSPGPRRLPDVLVVENHSQRVTVPDSWKAWDSWQMDAKLADDTHFRISVQVYPGQLRRASCGIGGDPP